MEVGKTYLKCLVPSLGEDRQVFFADAVGMKEHSYDEKTQTNVVVWEDGTREEIKVLSEVLVTVSAKENRCDIGICNKKKKKQNFIAICTEI